LIWKRSGWIGFIAGMLPGVALIAAFNAYLYGSPFESGYGDLNALYAWGNAPGNLMRYGRWLVATETPIVALALFGFFRPPRAILAVLSAFALGVLAAYLFYAPFDAWWYLRFLLPALPMLLVLAASGALWLVSTMPSLARLIAVSCGLVLLAGHQLGFAASEGTFMLREGQERYVRTAEYANVSLPANAAIVCMQHSGSLRYYAGRLTVRYDWIPSDWFDRTIAMLRANGFRPFIVLEDWEEADFRARFASAGEMGRLDQLPLAILRDGVIVRVYEPPPSRTP
jgi:hypothetical protein